MLSSYLVRAKLYQLKKKVSSPRCGKQISEVCNDVTDATIFRNTVTENTLKINHSLNYDEKCLIYLVTCKQYKKQYTGKNTDQFHDIWNNYKNNAKKFDRKEVMYAGTFI